ncbi:MAG: 1-acyl-sn-glycerol-3-phosphate acyltransferase, partial [Anaerolineales bacterium]|nr:1-acyl-sn-glycerol-3-phosphate acyltransferase [Anaerolineales bacterium]
MSKGRLIFRRWACFVLRVFLRLCTRLEIKGLDNIPQGGPLLVAFNHLAHLDAALVLALVPQPVE